MSQEKKKTYREEMLTTAQPFTINETCSVDEMLSLGGMGLAEEAGEVLGIIKKCVFHKHPLDEAKRKKILSELGDCRWYFELLLYRLGATMEEVEQINIAKLRERYPNGFTPECSLNRKKED